MTLFKLLTAAAGTGIVPADRWSVFGGGFRRGAFRLAPRENHLRSRPGGGGGRSNRNSYFENRPDDVGLKNSEQFLKNPVSFIFIFNQRIAPSTSPQPHGTAQVFHCFKMVHPKKIKGSQKNKFFGLPRVFFADLFLFGGVRFQSKIV